MWAGPALPVLLCLTLRHHNLARFRAVLHLRMTGRWAPRWPPLLGPMPPQHAAPSGASGLSERSYPSLPEEQRHPALTLATLVASRAAWRGVLQLSESAVQGAGHCKQAGGRRDNLSMKG
ncbi:hypothetical protein Agub_g4907 [Astrephomene gubernaculifera]|uniref:Uncharacterized protein n=1 Tax=Astrephomene gubernaculifera TaxID=47775 RepID=A0AAD3HKK4_9CHLO|nr:hypothetical protein Agub_g4907 [Astrephomene gubernaculifera]